MSPRPRVAIIGAGPIGIEAALAFQQHGDEVTLIERGEIGSNLTRWGHVKLFSPFGMNSSHRGRKLLKDAGQVLPSDDAILSGHDFRQQYLLPITKILQQKIAIHSSSKVTHIGREELLKSDLVGQPERGRSPFLIRYESDYLSLATRYSSRNLTADIVLDCSGTFGNHSAIGSGGIPCLGEDQLQQVNYGLPDMRAFSSLYLGKTTLVIGGGYSAATNVVALGELAKQNSNTKIIWVTRQSNQYPMIRIENDALNERDQLALNTNQLVKDGIVEWLPGTSIEEINQHDKDILVVLKNADQPYGFQKVAESIIANVGYKPDHSIYEELQVHQCYATQGPMKLAAALMGETSADCLTQSSHGPETIQTTEPNFFILGAKSYGRNSKFLMKIGLEQIEQVLSILEKEQ